jgi:hypothetical protein
MENSPLESVIGLGTEGHMSKFAGASDTLAIVVAGLLSFASASMSLGAQPGERADRERITAIIESWEKAWNSHDMRAFASAFHEDGIWIL